MKLATPLKLPFSTDGLRFRDANGVLVTNSTIGPAFTQIIADHARLTADLADAVALLKECRQEFYDICHSSGDPADPAYTSSPAHLYRDCAALVARVEART